MALTTLIPSHISQIPLIVHLLSDTPNTLKFKETLPTQQIKLSHFWCCIDNDLCLGKCVGFNILQDNI